MYYSYTNKAKDYGGYESSAISNNTETWPVVFTQDAEDHTIFRQTNTVTVKWAGIYTPTLTYKVNNTDYAVKSDLASKFAFSVYSVAPSIAITSISPTGTFDVDKTGEGSGHASDTVPAFTATEATVYFKCSRSGSGSTCDPYRHNYSRPSVTITMSNMGNAASAELKFGDDIHVYNGTTKTTGYSWTANGGVARNIGYYRSRTAANDNKTPAGTLNATTLTLTTADAKTYTVPVSITINNPY